MGHFGVSLWKKAISIYALHTGMRQSSQQGRSKKDCNFNPRTPYRDATWQYCQSGYLPGNFNPRTPYRDATDTQSMRRQKLCGFQSTHPIQGCDKTALDLYFDNRPISIHAPHTGMRLGYKSLDAINTSISIHAPHTGMRHSACSLQRKA